MIKSLILRFVRGAVAGAVASMITLLPFTGTANEWGDLQTWLFKLGFAGVIGLISGGLLTIDKYCRTDWK